MCDKGEITTVQTLQRNLLLLLLLVITCYLLIISNYSCNYLAPGASGMHWQRLLMTYLTLTSRWLCRDSSSRGDESSLEGGCRMMDCRLIKEPRRTDIRYARHAQTQYR